MNLTAALIFRFIDRLSGPARAAARAVGDIDRAQKMAARASAQWSRGLDQLDGKLDRLAKISLVTEGLDRAGQSMARPLMTATRNAAEFEQGMTGIGITAQLTDRQLAPLRRTILSTASELGALPATVQATFGAVLAEGVYRTEEDLSRAGRAVARFQKLAETMRDPVSDAEAGALSSALGGSYRMASDQLDRANAMINRSAQLGGVGIGSIARVLPEQSGALVGLNFANDRGLADLLAANQIAKRLAGTSEQATNNISNLMGKLASPEVLRNFSEIGINLEAEIKRGVEAGKSPLMTLAEITRRASSADQFRIGELVGDVQAKAGLMALVQNLDDFRSMSAELQGDDVLNAYMADLARAAGGPAAAFARYTASMSRAGIATGVILAPAASWAANMLERVANWMAAAEESGNPLARMAVFAAAGFAGVAVAAGAVGNAVMGILGPFFILKSIFGDLGQGAIAGGWARIAGAIGRARGAAMAFNLTMLANPVVLGIAAAVAAIAVVALVVRKYWQPIKAFMTGVGQGVAEAFAPLAAVLAPLRPIWDAIASGIGKAWTWITRILEPVRSTQEELAGATSAGRSFGRVLGAALKIPLLPLMALGYVGARVFGFVRSLFNWSPTATLSRLWTPIGGFFGRLWSGAQSIVSQGLAGIAGLVMRFTMLGPIVRNWSAITGFLGRVWTLASEIVGLGIDSIKLAVLRFTPLGLIVRNWSAITGFFGRVWSSVATATAAGMGAVGGFIQRWNPISMVARNWTPIAGLVGRVWGLVSGVVGRGIARVAGLLVNASPLGIIIRNWTPITGFIGGVWTTIRGLVAAGLRAIGAALSSWSPLSALQTAFAGAFSWLQTLPARFTTMGSNIVDGMIAGIRGRRAAVQGAAAAAAGGTATAAAGALGIRSPSRVFARLGDFTMQGLAQGLGRSASGPLARVAALAASLGTVWPTDGLATTLAIEAERPPVAASRPLAPSDRTRIETTAALPPAFRPEAPSPMGIAAALARQIVLPQAVAPAGERPAPAPVTALRETASPLGWVAELASRIILPVPSGRSENAPIGGTDLGAGFVGSLVETMARLIRPERASADPADPNSLAPTPPLIGATTNPAAPGAASQPAAAASAPAPQVHHHYGDQHFTVSGEGKSVRELARELDRLRRTAGRAGMHDGAD